MLTQSNKTTITSLADKWKVNPDIHPDDFIFQFLYNNPTFSNTDAAIQYYFNDGHNSAEQLYKLLTDICKYDVQQKIDLLEFASGYGCVTRHMKNTLPFVNVTACDIHGEATNFIKEKLKVNVVSSRSTPEQLALAEKFDVVFALSFFSHMPKSSFGRWLRELSSLVKPGGYFIFTTHGILSRSVLSADQFDKDGFWFKPSSEQKDLNVSEYGLTCTLPKYVLSLLFENSLGSLKYFQEGFWWKHQDVYVVRIGESSSVLKQEKRLNRIHMYVNKLRGRQ